MGKAMFLFGIAGMVVCILLLVLLPKLFQKQRRHMLDELNTNLHED